MDFNRHLKIIKANESVDKMKSWYQENNVPDTLKIGCLNIQDTKTYIQTAFNTLEHSEVLSQHFRASYLRLFHLKQHLEKKEK